MLFVFGKRAKKMRLNKLSELIHNSSSMKDLRFARVTVYFKEIRDLEDNNFEEIPNSSFVLSREVYKNSTSKYLYDGREIHFESLCNILEQKGIDLKHNRFLILQGEVEQISMMKPKGINAGEIGLLEFLEDIIGTSRFVNIIEKFGKNIDDLYEIKQQKGNRLKHLRNELNQLEDVKNNATDYFKKEKQLFSLNHLENLIKSHEIKKESEKITNILKQLENKIEEVEMKKKEKANENKSTLDELKKIQEKLKIIEAEAQKREALIDDLDSQDRNKRIDIDNKSKQIQKIKMQLEKLNRNFTETSENITKAGTELPKREADLERLKSSKDKLEKEVMQKEAEVYNKTQKFQQKIRELESYLVPFDSKIKKNKLLIDQNSSTIHLLNGDSNKIIADISSNEQEKEMLEYSIQGKKQEFNKKINDIENIKSALVEADKQVKIIQQAEEQKAAELHALQAKISEIQVSNQERNQRSKLLEALLKAQEQGELRGIYGRLGDLGSIDSKYDVAISTCNGVHLNNILVERVDDATQAIDFLRRNALGRATFLILEKQLHYEQKMFNFRDIPECPRIFDLIKVNNQRFLPAFYSIFKDTLVADNLATAHKYGYGNPRYRVVTLAGELIEIYGTMSGGGKPRRGAMSNKIMQEDASNNQEYLKKLREEYEKLSKELKQKNNEKLTSENRKNNLSQSFQMNIISKNQIENELGNIEKNLSDINKTLLSLKQESEKQKHNLENSKKLQMHNEELEQAILDLIEESKEQRSSLEKINEEINKISGEDFKKAQQDLKNLNKQIDDLEKEIHKLHHLIDNAPQIIQKLKAEIEVKDQVIKENERIIESITKEMAEIEKQAENTYAQIEMLNREKSNMNNNNQQVIDSLNALKEEMNKLNAQRDKIIADKNDCKNELKKIEKMQKVAQDDLDKNKFNYNKFMEEYGFIDEFEKEISQINNQNNEDVINLDLETDQGEGQELKDKEKKNKADDESSDNFIEINVNANKHSESFMDIDDDSINKAKSNNFNNKKIMKKANNYEKYINPKYFNMQLLDVELDELLPFSVI